MATEAVRGQRSVLVQIFKQPRGAGLRILAARSARAVRERFAQNRGRMRPLRKGAGKAGCPLHPQSVCNGSKHTVVTTGSPEHPAFPAQRLYGLFRALPGDRAFLPPSLPRSLLLENLTPASGRQDHTTSPSATSASSGAPSHLTPLRPSHPTPNVRDDRDTPLSRGGVATFQS
jgi:hypothetical protein